MDWSALSFLPPRVRLPKSPSTLLSFIVKNSFKILLPVNWTTRVGANTSTRNGSILSVKLWSLFRMVSTSEAAATTSSPPARLMARATAILSGIILKILERSCTTSKDTRLRQSQLASGRDEITAALRQTVSNLTRVILKRFKTVWTDWAIFESSCQQIFSLKWPKYLETFWAFWSMSLYN